MLAGGVGSRSSSSDGKSNMPFIQHHASTVAGLAK